jgi:hypothetical protein
MCHTLLHAGLPSTHPLQGRLLDLLDLQHLPAPPLLLCLLLQLVLLLMAPVWP